MGDIISYVQEKGNLSFDEWEFNRVDSLVLSELSYLDFHNTKAIYNGFEVTFSELKEQDIESFSKETLFPDKNKELFINVIGSKRFGAIYLGYYRHHQDRENEKQFAAITFRLKKNLYYVAYRGTDGSFVGWKEDLNLSFLPNIPAQSDAVSYYEKVSKWRKGIFLLGGHSKGGNLAVYTAMRCNKHARKKIRAVYNHDGPGFLREVFSTAEYETINHLIHKTVPQDSIVGLLLEQHGDYSVIESNAFSFLQHNPFNWIVENGDFISVKSVTFLSEYTNQTLNTWLMQLEMETRKEFVDHLYEIFKSTNVETIPELLALGKDGVKILYRSIKESDPDKKNMMYEAIGDLIRISFSEMKELLSKKLTLKKKDLDS